MFFRMLGVKPGAAGPRSKYAKHCAMQPPPNTMCLYIELRVHEGLDSNPGQLRGNCVHVPHQPYFSLCFEVYFATGKKAIGAIFFC